MNNNYKDKQRELDSKATQEYNAISGSLTAAQHRAVFTTFKGEDSYGDPVAGKDTANGITIVRNSNKQEPNARKTCYDDNGNVEIADNFDYSPLDTREDIVRECIRTRGNLNRLIQSFVFEDLRSYETQLFTKFANLIIDSDNPKIELIAFLKAAGKDMGNGEFIAKTYGVTRQAVSKKTITKKNKLGMPDNTRDSKNSESRDVYRGKNHRPTKI